MDIDKINELYYRHMELLKENAGEKDGSAHPYPGPLTDLGGGYYWAAERDGDRDDQWYNFFLLKSANAENNLYKTLSSFIKMRDYDLNLISDDSDRIKAWLKKNKGIDLGGEKIEANDEDAENMDNVSARMHAKQAAREEQNPPYGYPQGMTAIQNLLINLLKKYDFKLTKISHEDKERDKYPTVFMMRSRGPMHSVAEISGMGAINDEHFEDYLANLKAESEDEDAEDYVAGMGMPDFTREDWGLIQDAIVDQIAHLEQRWGDTWGQRQQEKVERLEAILKKMSFNPKRNLAKGLAI